MSMSFIGRVAGGRACAAGRFGFDLPSLPHVDRAMSYRQKYVQFISAAGLHRMAYTEWGDPANPRVVICVHGLTRSGRDFDELAAALSGDFRVVCPDVAGRGLSA